MNGFESALKDIRDDIRARIRYAKEVTSAIESLHRATGVDYMSNAEARKNLARLIYPEGEEQRRDLLRRLEIDKLTGVANREALDKALPSAETDTDISVIVFDANNFGKINKIDGHEAGDKILKSMAEKISLAAREYGVQERVFRIDGEGESGPTAGVFRRGGDEFVVLAPSQHADKILERSEKLFGVVDRGSFKVSLTGMVGKTFEEADAILQTAKKKRKETDG